MGTPAAETHVAGAIAYEIVIFGPRCAGTVIFD
jgi:hypothetical protein